MHIHILLQIKTCRPVDEISDSYRTGSGGEPEGRAAEASPITGLFTELPVVSHKCLTHFCVSVGVEVRKLF